LISILISEFQAAWVGRNLGATPTGALFAVSLISQHPRLSQLHTPNFTFLTMASASTSLDRDVEAQRDVLQPHRASYHLARYYPLGWNVLTIFEKELGEDEIHETANSPSVVASDASRAPAGFAQPVISESQGIADSIFPRPRVPVRHTILILS
jgi:hypothetical protein